MPLRRASFLCLVLNPFQNSRVALATAPGSELASTGILRPTPGPCLRSVNDSRTLYCFISRCLVFQREQFYQTSFHDLENEGRRLTERNDLQVKSGRLDTGFDQ